MVMLHMLILHDFIVDQIFPLIYCVFFLINSMVIGTWSSLKYQNNIQLNTLKVLIKMKVLIYHSF